MQRWSTCCRASRRLTSAALTNAAFYECHHTLEKLWRPLKGGEREFIQGLIQAAVGFQHFFMNNRQGALKLLSRGCERLKDHQPSCLGYDTKCFVDVISSDLETLRSAGADEHIQLIVPLLEKIPD